MLVSDLPGQLLGATTGDTIVLDGTAAGYGWFVDPTPLGNHEFPLALANGVFAASPGSAAYGRMDLLTTVLHELGNAMGFAEDLGQDVTGATLQAGVRRLPTSADVPPAVAAGASGGDAVLHQLGPVPTIDHVQGNDRQAPKSLATTETQVFNDDLGVFVGADQARLLQFSGNPDAIKFAGSDFIHLGDGAGDGKGQNQTGLANKPSVAPAATPASDKAAAHAGVIEWGMRSNLLTRLASRLGSALGG